MMSIHITDDKRFGFKKEPGAKSSVRTTQTIKEEDFKPETDTTGSVRTPFLISPNGRDRHFPFNQ